MNKQPSTFDEFFSECYLKYQGFIKNYIAIRICHPYEAEDLAQDVFPTPIIEEISYFLPHLFYRIGNMPIVKD
jgi:hypothetical protein